MDLNDSADNLLLSQMPIDFLADGDELDNSAENLFLSQVDESVLQNEAFLNADSSFDLGLDLENFINSCEKSENAETSGATDDDGSVKGQATSTPATKRFGSPATDDDILHLKESVRNKNTDKNTKWAIGIFEEWRQQRQGSAIPEIQTMDKSPRCLATLWTLYLDTLGNAGDFYRRPIPGPTLRYGKQAVCVNKLGNFMKDICKKGGLSGNFTNHSGKRTCASSLYSGGIDEQDIMARTGHRSTSAVRVYKRCTDDIRKTVSRVLDPNPPKRQACENEDPDASTSGTSDMHDVKPGHGSSERRAILADIASSSSGTVNFSGCTFNF